MNSTKAKKIFNFAHKYANFHLNILFTSLFCKAFVENTKLLDEDIIRFQQQNYFSAPGFPSSFYLASLYSSTLHSFNSTFACQSVCRYLVIILHHEHYLLFNLAGLGIVVKRELRTASLSRSVANTPQHQTRPSRLIMLQKFLYSCRKKLL